MKEKTPYVTLDLSTNERVVVKASEFIDHASGTVKAGMPWPVDTEGYFINPAHIVKAKPLADESRYIWLDEDD